MTIRTLAPDQLVAACNELRLAGWRLATIAVTDSELPELRYVFWNTNGPGWQQLRVAPPSPMPEGVRRIPSLTPTIVAADWLEREIEDLFAIDFEGHPRLGDFVLHDSRWEEGVGPMRAGARTQQALVERAWRPRRVLRDEGAFVMPVGPVYSGEAESALFLLETVGEDVVRTVPRLFYKYRGIEKLAQQRSVDDALLLVERANGTSAFAHAWTYCMAAEEILQLAVPDRALRLRTIFAEVERIRRHIAVLRAIVDSTALWVPAARLLELEEHLLRMCGDLTGHRYLFGFTVIGGLQRDVNDEALTRGVARMKAIVGSVRSIVVQLERTSSFLDRIQRVGILSPERAHEFGVVGPFARASRVAYDLRRIQPYGAYQDAAFEPPTASEGDGYARLRVLAEEIAISLSIVEQLERDLRPGPVRVEWTPSAGEALAWCEAPAGATVQLLRLNDEGRCTLLRFTPPSFRNWQSFRWVTEDFAFQDFPIILATCGLSVAENDR